MKRKKWGSPHMNWRWGGLVGRSLMRILGVSYSDNLELHKLTSVTFTTTLCLYLFNHSVASNTI